MKKNGEEKYKPLASDINYLYSMLFLSSLSVIKKASFKEKSLLINGHNILK
jgi:hypothetical protein